MKSLVTLALFLLVCIMMGLWFLSWPAKAEDGSCFLRADLMKALAQANQTSIAAGTVDAGTVEVFATTDGAKWTLIINREDGSACIVGGGTNWQAAASPDAKLKLDPNSGDSI